MIDSDVNENSKKIALVMVMIGILMFGTIGATFAYFAIGANDNSTITGTAATAGLDLTVIRVAPTTANFNSSSKIFVPQLNRTLANAIGTCVDGNGNVVCGVYSITVRNTSTSTVLLNGTLTFDGISSMPNLSWKPLTSATAINTNSYGTSFFYKATSVSSTNSSSSGTANARLVSNLSLANNASSTMYIVVWIDEIEAEQTDSGTFTGTVNFEASNGEGITSTFS